MISQKNLRIYLSIACVFLLNSLAAQVTTFSLCDSTRKFRPQYYQFPKSNKYPLSSENLTEKANKALTTYPPQINGFVAIRFLVNCKGETGNFEIYQIDENYLNTQFEPTYIQELLAFTKNLNGWNKAIYKEKSFDYYTYLTFRIKHGIVTEIVP